MSIDTVNDLEPRVQYVATAAQTDFDYPFPIFADADLKVYVDGVLKTLTTHYTVAGEGEDAGGTVTFITPMSGDEVVTIVRELAVERLTDFQQNGPWSSTNYNDEQDKTYLILQEIKSALKRALRLPNTTEVDTDDLELPAAAWASKYLAFDADGAPTPAALSAETMTQATIGALLNPRTQAEIDASVTPTSYAISPRPFFDVTRYGASPSASASANSTAIQNAVDAAYAAGGGVVFIPEGTFNTDAPILVYENVSIIGAGKNATIVKKTTSTASSVSDATSRFWDSASVGNPVCVFHFVGHNGTDNWSYAECRDIQARGDTSSPNTTAVVYGFFFRGATGCRIQDCFAQYVQVGYFWGGGSTIVSDISGNHAGNVQRGFYQHFMTSTAYHHNYANKFRYAGHFLSWYYSDVFANAADNVGAPWKVGTTEISLAYQGNSCRGGSFHGNGCETHNGSVFKFSNCVSVNFSNNLALDITSDYTGGSDVALWENDSNNACVYLDNRMQTTSVTGTAGRHFMYKITSELGSYLWQRNKFVAGATDTTNSSTWANTSGTINETEAVLRVSGTFTPTVAGSGTAGTTTYTTQSGSYERIGNVVKFRLRVGWSAQTGAGNLLIGGLPYTSENTENDPVTILADSLTFSNQLAAFVRPNSTIIDVYSMSTGASAAAVSLDTAGTVWISGEYRV